MHPDDERRHPPGPEPLWGESWYFDFAAADGAIGGYVRVGLYPNQRVAWYWAYLAGPGRPTIAVRDHDVPLPTSDSLEIRAEGLWAQTLCETPHEHWTIGLEAFGVALDDPADGYRGERGERVGLGFDLEWEEAGPVYPYSLTTRYEQACRVHGEILVGRDERIAFDGFGERDHSWGVRDWWSFPWCWTAGRLDDGTAFHAAGTEDFWHQGFVQPGGGAQQEVDRFRVDTDLGAEGLPTAARMQVGADLALEVTPVAHTAIRLDAPDGRWGKFPRSLCRFTAAGGPAGYGWTEWNQPQA